MKISIKIPQVIMCHKYMNYIETFKFDDYKYNFPNTREAHVSLRTYFRLFISNYLPKTSNQLYF